MPAKKINTFIFLFFFTFFTAIASVRSDIRYLVKKYRLSDASIGIAAERVNSGKMLYQYAENRPFTPASNNKIFTAIAALTVLPDDFTFNTTVYYNKDHYINGVLKDNLYIKFSGDPSLTGSELYNLISQIRQHGIRQINGNIIVVADKFSGRYIPEGWSKSDANYCYAAPSSTLNLNRNCFTFKLMKASNNHTNIESVANTTNIRFLNNARLAPYRIRKNCPFKMTMNQQNQLKLSGCLPENAEFYLSLAIKNPALKTLNTVKDFFKQTGIRYSGKVVIGSMPVFALYQMAEIRSEPLADLLTHMLLKSDNLYAESLARTVGYYVYGTGSTEMATKAIKSVLENKYHANIRALTMKDGSGLSHLDKVTPKFMVSLLTKVYNSRIGKQLYQSLPTSGTDGTLTYRMGGYLKGKVHAKTGTLEGVSTLSGYLISQKHHLISFSIMLNGLKSKQERYRARSFQDRVAGVFYKSL